MVAGAFDDANPLTEGMTVPIYVKVESGNPGGSNAPQCNKVGAGNIPVE